jgi:DNA mismatch repair ATPase MutS
MKMHNWDKVLLFQKGKFYELYYTDAIIGHYFLKIGWSWSPQQPNSGEVSSRYDSGPTFSNPLSVGIHYNVLNKHCQELIDLGF